MSNLNIYFCILLCWYQQKNFFSNSMLHQEVRKRKFDYIDQRNILPIKENLMLKSHRYFVRFYYGTDRGTVTRGITVFANFQNATKFANRYCFNLKDMEHNPIYCVIEDAYTQDTYYIPYF